MYFVYLNSKLVCNNTVFIYSVYPRYKYSKGRHFRYRKHIAIRFYTPLPAKFGRTRTTLYATTSQEPGDAETGTNLISFISVNCNKQMEYA